MHIPFWVVSATYHYLFLFPCKYCKLVICKFLMILWHFFYYFLFADSAVGVTRKKLQPGRCHHETQERCSILHKTSCKCCYSLSNMTAVKINEYISSDSLSTFTVNYFFVFLQNLLTQELDSRIWRKRTTATRP